MVNSRLNKAGYFLGVGGIGGYIEFGEMFVND